MFGESVKLVFVVGRDAQDADTNSTIDEPFGSIDFDQLEIEVTSVGFNDAILVHPFPVDQSNMRRDSLQYTS